jgi:hypothetical protein
VRDVGEQLALALQQRRDAIRHLIERLRDGADLVAPIQAGASVELAAAELARHARYMPERHGQ